jgi:hypothetical protein
VTLKSVIDIDIDDAKFQRFKALFDKYQAALAKTPDMWAKANKEQRATTGAATTANTIYTAAAGSLTVGESLQLEWPCFAGIVISAVPTSSQFAVTFS